jgi:hypothetical protein
MLGDRDCHFRSLGEGANSSNRVRGRKHKQVKQLEEVAVGARVGAGGASSFRVAVVQAASITRNQQFYPPVAVHPSITPSRIRLTSILCAY